MRLHCPQPDKLPLKCLTLCIGSRISCCASRTFACRVALNDRTHNLTGMLWKSQCLDSRINCCSVALIRGTHTHASLRQPLLWPEPTSSRGSATRWQLRTPAMAAGLTDRVWTLRELLLFRVP